MADFFRPSFQWRERGFRKPGRKPDSRRAVLMHDFGLSLSQARKYTVYELDQLDRCKDDEARRILIGGRLSTISTDSAENHI